MSRYIATHALRGANTLVTEAELMLNKALVEKGPETPVAFPNTAYYLPVIYGMTGTPVEKLGQLSAVIHHARELLHPAPAGGRDHRSCALCLRPAARTHGEVPHGRRNSLYQPGKRQPGG